jgi:hypothetical protein
MNSGRGKFLVELVVPELNGRNVTRQNEPAIIREVRNRVLERISKHKNTDPNFNVDFVHDSALPFFFVTTTEEVALLIRQDPEVLRVNQSRRESRAEDLVA